MQDEKIQPQRGFIFHFKRYVWPYLHYISVTMILMLVSSVLYLFAPQWLGELIDRIKEGTVDVAAFQSFMVKISVLILLQYILNGIWSYGVFSTYYRIVSELRTKIMRRALFEKPSYFLKFLPSVILSRLDQDVMNIGDLGGYGFMCIHDGVVLPIMIFFFMWRIYWPMTLVIIAMYPFLVWMMRRLFKEYDLCYERTQKKREQLYDQTLATVTELKTIRVFSAEGHFKKKFLESVSQALDAEYDMAKIVAKLAPVWRTTYAAFGIVLLGFGGYAIGQGRMTIGDLISFSFYLNLLLWPIMALSDILLIMNNGRGALKRIDALLTEDHTSAYKNKDEVGERFEKLTFEHYDFYYPGESRAALKDICLDIAHGEVIGLAGKVGSGKTTLIEQILHFYPDYSGDKFFNGRQAREVNERQWRALFRYVPQEHFLFSRSVRGNIDFFRNLSKEEIDLAVRRADFEKDLSALPQGLETVCGERGITLSGGQKQRISLARALAQPGEVIVLDDVLSAVDSKTERTILNNLEQMMKGQTMIISSHRLSALRHATRIYVLQDGAIVQVGRFEDLIEQDGWFREQYRLQKRGEGSDEKDQQE